MCPLILAKNLIRHKCDLIRVRSCNFVYRRVYRGLLFNNHSQIAAGLRPPNAASAKSLIKITISGFERFPGRKLSPLQLTLIASHSKVIIDRRLCYRNSVSKFRTTCLRMNLQFRNTAVLNLY